MWLFDKQKKQTDKHKTYTHEFIGFLIKWSIFDWFAEKRWGPCCLHKYCYELLATGEWTLFSMA